MSARFQCQCCGFLTLPEKSPGSFEICHVCLWQDDMVGFREPHRAAGPNAVSLNDARRNFKTYGACEQRFVAEVRPPRAEEMPTAGGPEVRPPQ